MSRGTISIEEVCNSIISKEVVACGIEDEDFFIEFADGSTLIFWSDEDLNMSFYKDAKGTH